MDSKYSFISSWNNCSKCFANNELWNGGKLYWWKNCDDAYSVRYCRFMVHISCIYIHVSFNFIKGVYMLVKLIPDKANLGFRFPCDGPGRGGTCQSSSWDHVFLGLFWMYNSISVVIFHQLENAIRRLGNYFTGW
jgi:hypothetical protein